MQLRTVGVRTLSELKGSCRDFERYMAVNYEYEIVKKKNLDPGATSPKSRTGWNMSEDKAVGGRKRMPFRLRTLHG
jgi:hypothetical protein